MVNKTPTIKRICGSGESARSGDSVGRVQKCEVDVQMQRTLCNCKPSIIAWFTGFYQSPGSTKAITAFRGRRSPGCLLLFQELQTPSMH